LSLEVVVSASGEFSYPLLERVVASGHTAHSLARRMEQRLREEQFLRFPSVNVVLSKQRSSVATLSGAVNSPGTHPLMPSTRLREFLADHGGVMSEDAGPLIVIQRANGSTLRVQRDGMFSEDVEIRVKSNPVLEPGDEIIVPESTVFFVSGAVNKPAEYRIDREITVRDAVAAAGGCKVESGNSVFWQRRLPDGQYETVIFNKAQLSGKDGEILQPVGPGDLIYVPNADTFFIGGGVKAPGEFQHESGMTLSRAITLAGDRVAFSSNKITLIREGKDGEKTVSNFDLKSIRRGKSEDPLIQPGDILTVTGGFLGFSSKARYLLPISVPWGILNEM
ncbi:MAG: SLBB domain-containing protein, partial [bacterium]